MKGPGVNTAHEVQRDNTLGRSGNFPYHSMHKASVRSFDGRLAHAEIPFLSR